MDFRTDCQKELYFYSLIQDASCIFISRYFLRLVIERVLYFLCHFQFSKFHSIFHFWQSKVNIVLSEKLYVYTPQKLPNTVFDEVFISTSVPKIYARESCIGEGLVLERVLYFLSKG